MQFNQIYLLLRFKKIKCINIFALEAKKTSEGLSLDITCRANDLISNNILNLKYFHNIFCQQNIVKVSNICQLFCHCAYLNIPVIVCLIFSILCVFSYETGGHVLTPDRSWSKSRLVSSNIINIRSTALWHADPPHHP